MAANSIYGEKKETQRLQADATSLADLKAEMVRKKAEAVQNKQKGNFRPEKRDGDSKKANIWSKENTGVLARMQKDMENAKEEERTWQHSRSVMERKSRIYNSLKAGKGRSEIANNFLVEFDKKSDSDSDSDDDRERDYDYPADGEGDEWVEYTDSLGRTRTCMRKDLKRLQSKNTNTEKRRDRSSSSSSEDEDEAKHKDDKKDEPDLLSEDMRRQILREKWEKEEMENLEKDSLHYSDVRYDEARAHGAAFYAFSRDEQTRAKEQVTLKKFHEETDAARKEKEIKAEKRKQEMADRIRKIKAKKREKLGLPPLEDETGSKIENNYEEINSNADFTKSVSDGLKMFRKNQEEEEKRKNEIRRRENLRDWDVGKDGLDDMKKEWKVLTQQEWLAKQRQQRTAEFAPPTAFNEAKNILKRKDKDFFDNKSKKRQKDKLNASLSIPQPASNIFKKTIKVDPMAALDIPKYQSQNYYENEAEDGAGGCVDPMRNLDKTFSVPPPPFFIDREGSSSYQASSKSNSSTKAYSTAMRINLHKKMQEDSCLPQPGLNSKIINELDKHFDDSIEETDIDDNRRGQGNEIAPPCSMQYFANTSASKISAKSQFASSMKSAFEQGLQAQKK